MTQNTPPAKIPETRVIAVRVPAKIHKKFRQMAANKETTIQDIAIEAFQQYLEAQ